MKGTQAGPADGVAPGDLRLADVLAALSVATDLGMGHQPGKAARSCLLATELARELDLPEPRVREVYDAALLLHLGCTAPAHELAHLTGDERRFLARAEGTDEDDPRDALRLLAAVGAGTGWRRPRHLLRTLTAGKAFGVATMRATCEVGSRLAERLHLGDRVAAALHDSTEVWDGSSGAHGRSGDDIALAARFALLAAQAVLYDEVAGPDAALEVVRVRTGHWFDPEVAGAFARRGADLLAATCDGDVWADVLAAEPQPVRCVPGSRIDEVAAVFADVVDLKSTYTLGHSSGVAALAAGAATRLRCGEEQVTTVRRAALLHDLGRIAVSDAVWEQPRALSRLQWEQVRLHPYHSERILQRSQVLAPLARTAGMHHERPDGAGYHHGAGGAELPLEARLLAAADRFHAMTEERPHRPALAPEQAARTLEAEADAGAVDGECARAVVAAAGESPGRRPASWPAGLTDREVDVIRLLARGRTNRQIADELVISPRTAEHHVQHVYGKIGASTRASAALFALEQGLLR